MKLIKNINIYFFRITLFDPSDDEYDGDFSYDD